MRREYLAVGIRLALHPTADVATEPRWCRAAGTFGEDAEVAARLVTAYLSGMQLETLGRESVACMTKHFPGGGPQLDGEDPHFSYGREQVYPGGNSEYHLIPFAAAIEAGGSSLRDYARPSGELGYFSKQWRVYGREGKNCLCGGTIRRRVDSGRSTFFCPRCQRG